MESTTSTTITATSTEHIFKNINFIRDHRRFHRNHYKLLMPEQQCHHHSDTFQLQQQQQINEKDTNYYRSKIRTLVSCIGFNLNSNLNVMRVASKGSSGPGAGRGKDKRKDDASPRLESARSNVCYSKLNSSGSCLSNCNENTRNFVKDYLLVFGKYKTFKNS